MAVGSEISLRSSRVSLPRAPRYIFLIGDGVDVLTSPSIHCLFSYTLSISLDLYFPFSIPRGKE